MAQYFWALVLLSAIYTVNGDDSVPALVTIKQGKLQGSLENLLDGATYYNFKGIPYAQPPIGKLRFATSPIVTITQGKLKGAVRNLIDGSPYFSFKGIPYARPPVGELRFKAPQSPQPWQGVYEATEHGHVCPQYDIFTRQYIDGSEDCLFLNVYTKSLNKDSCLPVMVFIHGGAFQSGSGNVDSGYGPEFLLQHDVVLVTINYRLEVLGFLCLDTPEVPGNAGMKDQVAALKWVQKNIEQFGGNPDNVTIFGESVGAASVAYHMQSPMSKGLFHKAICQSGTSIADWAQGKEGLKRAFRLAKQLGNETTDVKDLYDFLCTVPAKKFSRMTFKTMTADEKHRGLPIHFAPVVEKKFDNVEQFVSEEPIQAVTSEVKMMKIPMMLGYTSLESILMYYDSLKKADFINNNPQYLVPREIAEKVSSDKLKELGQRIMKFYFGDKVFDEDTAMNMLYLFADVHFTHNAHRFAQLYSSEALYMYRFCLDTDLNVVKNILGLTHIKGACHADDLYYFFCSALNRDAYEGQEKLRDIVFRLTKLWTDFAKTGNPTPEGSKIKWPKYTKSKQEVLNLGDTFEFGPCLERDRIDFWNKLYLEVGLPCFVKSNL